MLQRATKAIVRRPTRCMLKGETTSLQGPPNYEIACQQHDAYISALEYCGLQVHVLPSLDAFPDSCFVEDTAVCTPSIAVLSRPGAESRIGEVDVMKDTLQSMYETNIQRILSPGTLDGGDVVVMDKTVYVGISHRTNRSGAEQLLAMLRPYGYHGTMVHLPKDQLHLKCTISALNHTTLLASLPLWKPFDALKNVITLTEPKQDQYDANILNVNGKVICSVKNTSIEDAIGDKDYEIIKLNTSEFEKLNGAITCLSIIL